MTNLFTSENMTSQFHNGEMTLADCLLQVVQASDPCIVNAQRRFANWLWISHHQPTVGIVRKTIRIAADICNFSHKVFYVILESEWTYAHCNSNLNQQLTSILFNVGTILDS